MPSPASDHFGDDAIGLVLHGSHAACGIENHALRAFLDHLAGAMRTYARLGRGDVARRKGATTADRISTAFRVTSLRMGSAALAIEPSLEEGAANQLFPNEANGIVVLREVLEHARAGSLDPEPARELRSSFVALGRAPSMEVRLPGIAAFTLTEADITRLLGEDPPPPDTPPAVVTIIGALHMVDTDPARLGVRDLDGYEWICEVEDPHAVLRRTPLDSLVTVIGVVIGRAAKQSTIAVESLERHEVPEPVALWAFDPGAEAGAGGSLVDDLALILGEELPDDVLDRFLDDDDDR